MRTRKPTSKNNQRLLRQAAIYARVSTKEQAEEGYSLESQLRLLRSYALSQGITVIAEYVESETAKEAGRPKFGAMIAAIESGDVQVIICEKTDRLYRNLADRVRLGNFDVELHLVREGIVLSKNSKSHEKFMHDIQLVVAKKYVEHLSEEASKGMLEKAQQGIWPSTAPLGYINVQDGHRRVINWDPDRAELVGMLFRAFAEGKHSLKTVTAYAGEIGLRSRKGQKLMKGTVHWMLVNPIYRGVVPWKGEEYPGIHPPIIDAPTWWKVQEILTGRSSKASFGSKEHLYRGLFTCGRCGCTITGYVAKGTYTYYACNGSRGCSRSGVREEVIDAEVIRQLSGLTLQPEIVGMLRTALKASWEQLDRDRAPAVQSLEREKARLQSRLTAAYEDKLDAVIDTETYLRQTTKWRQELIEIEKSLFRFSRADQAYFDESVAMIEVAENLDSNYSAGSKEERREILQYLLSNCHIVAGKPVLGFKSWFKLMLETKESIDRNGGDYTDLKKWHPRHDSNVRPTA